MRIAVDARAIAGRHRGMGTYASNVARALVALQSPHEFVFYVDERDETAAVLESDRSSVVPISSGPIPGRAGRVWGSARPPQRTSGTIDVVLLTDLTLAPPVTGSVVSIVHDLIPLSVGAARPSREWPLAERVIANTAGAWVYRRGLRRIVRAAHVIASSHFTRQEVLSHLPEIEPARVSVVHLAAEPAFKPADAQHDLDRLGIAGPYVLYVGGVDPRKNVAGLLGAFDLVRRQFSDLSLVLVGREFRDARIAKKHRALFTELTGLSDEGVVITPGYVNQETLQSLYSGAACFVMPSLQEGFGIPALEAMQCRCPVIAGANSAQAEVVADAGLLVVPEPEPLAAAIATVLTDESLSLQLQDRGEARASEFSWDRTAKETLAILEEVAVAHLG